LRAIAIIALVCGVAFGDAPRTAAVGFDHLVHDRNLVVSGGEALACARCHVLEHGRLVGKPGHASCFGACHGAPPVRGKVPQDRIKVCEACHAEAALVAPVKGKLLAHYPPYTIDRDFNLALGHKQHAPVACTECHAVDSKAKPAPHARCAGCHDGRRGPAMEKCAGCHPPAIGKPQPPELMALRDSVTTTFSHARHAARGAKGKDCATCHAAIRATDDTELPRPSIKDCGVAGCHDGKAAFGTTTSCVRCHEKAPSDKFTVARPTARFAHGGPHAAAVSECRACHALAGNDVTIAGHAACASCHADDFGKREPKICGACHNATEPWRHLRPDRAPADGTEFGATLSHAKHPGACASCHSLRTASAQLRPPRGHAACATAGCHAANAGPAPHLTECNACHRAGLAAARAAARATDPWSVRAAFDHAPHGKAADGSALACNACHVDLGAADVLQLAPPAKATCAPCHDGVRAFSLTGTGCARCHVKEPR
jgi:c(7)-type cytochrome triheme protein